MGRCAAVVIDLLQTCTSCACKYDTSAWGRVSCLDVSYIHTYIPQSPRDNDKLASCIHTYTTQAPDETSVMMTKWPHIPHAYTHTHTHNAGAPRDQGDDDKVASRFIRGLHSRGGAVHNVARYPTAPEPNALDARIPVWHAHANGRRRPRQQAHAST
jgi:hypothetical protein